MGGGPIERTFGVEEEFLLVSPRTARTTARAAAVFRRATDATILPRGTLGITVQRELRDTQLEVATGICDTATELRQQLADGRRALAKAARAEGVIVVASGTPVLASAPLPGSAAGSLMVSRDRAPKNASGRFAEVDRLYRAVSHDYESCGCHVHVGVPDRDTAVAVVNHLARWLPTLLAISVNSPFHDGRDTGYGSWRMIMQSRFPGSGLPPWFANYAAYREEVDRLVACGVLVDECQTFWLARPSLRFPTVEFRVADTAALVDEALLQALLCRALVRAALAELGRGVEAEPVPAQLGAAAVWSAARYGLDGPGVHPRLGRRVPATELLDELLGYLSAALDELGDRPKVVELITRLRATGTGAARQRRMAPNGWCAVTQSLALAADQA